MKRGDQWKDYRRTDKQKNGEMNWKNDERKFIDGDTYRWTDRHVQRITDKR